MSGTTQRLMTIWAGAVALFGAVLMGAGFAATDGAARLLFATMSGAEPVMTPALRFAIALMGVGGGFILVPAMLYILGMSANVVVGTSLFQILFVTIATTMVHAMTTGAVDIVLAGLLLLGSVTGAQFGARFAQKVKPEYLRMALAVIVLLVSVNMQRPLDFAIFPTLLLITTQGRIAQNRDVMDYLTNPEGDSSPDQRLDDFLTAHTPPGMTRRDL